MDETDPTDHFREKRDWVRVPGPFRVVYERAGERREATALDLSAGGLLLAVDEALEPGAELAIELHLPNYAPLVLNGRAGARRARGVSVTFVDAHARQVSFLDAYATVMTSVPRMPE